MLGVSMTILFTDLSLSWAIGMPVAAGVFLLFMILIIISRFLVKVEPGKALIIISPFNKKGPKVNFTGGFVFPIIHKMEIMDISTKVMPVTRKGTDGLICKDNIRADITVHFYIRINKNEDDVRQVATSIGCKRASTHETLNELFQAKFSEALKTVGKQMEYEELFQERTRFKEEIIKTIGRDLNGYKLEDTAIDYLAQTPIEHLDPNDIMDSEGIKKITQLTSAQAILTNEIEQNKSETITKRNVEARERILELEKQQQEAEVKQQAEISMIKAREDAEKDKIVHEERLKAERAKIDTDEQLAIATENKNREVAIAEKNRERIVAIENEKIEQDRLLQVTERDKVVTLAEIAKEKEVEVEKKNIQEIIRQRVSVERAVAVEEEKTKDTRATAAAEREKQVEITLAEKEAEKKLIIDIKSAEAKEKAALHTAKEKNIIAEADKAVSLKTAEAKEIMAKGVIAERSAGGLAEIKVREAEADTIIKVGKANADAHKLKADAEAEATQKLGDANAVAYKAKADAEAEAAQKMGEAEAMALKAKYDADAAGIKEKAESMKLYDTVGREHEEFKLQLALREKLSLEEIKIKKDVAMAQADVLSAALKSAKIDLVGGESDFFDKLSRSIITGKTNSALIENNAVLNDFKEALLKPGDENVLMKIRKIVDNLGISSKTIQNLSVASLLNKLSSSTSDDGMLSQLKSIKGFVDKHGLGDLVLNVKDGLSQKE